MFLHSFKKNESTDEYTYEKDDLKILDRNISLGEDLPKNPINVCETKFNINLIDYKNQYIFQGKEQDLEKNLKIIIRSDKYLGENLLDKFNIEITAFTQGDTKGINEKKLMNAGMFVFICTKHILPHQGFSIRISKKK